MSVNFGPLFWKHKFVIADISQIFLPIATKFGLAMGFSEQHSLKNFGELWSTYSGAQIFGRNCRVRCLANGHFFPEFGEL